MKEFELPPVDSLGPIAYSQTDKANQLSVPRQDLPIS